MPWRRSDPRSEALLATPPWSRAIAARRYGTGVQWCVDDIVQPQRACAFDLPQYEWSAC
ncbi:protein of unknown function [Pararobbsia alpina]